jgi:CRISPR-associated exonuclease Cas4
MGDRERPRRVCVLSPSALVPHPSSTGGAYALERGVPGGRRAVPRRYTHDAIPEGTMVGGVVDPRGERSPPLCPGPGGAGSSVTPELWILVGLAGSGLLAAGVVALVRRRQQRKSGRLWQADLPTSPGLLLRSPRFRIAGRPDELRVLPDGRWVPVELKSRPAPRNGPPASHRIQVAAYCLLVEETTGRAPPFGLLRYGDGTEFRIEWTPELRARLLDLRRELATPYDGRALPSPGRCSGCPWRRSCDRAAV